MGTPSVLDLAHHVGAEASGVGQRRPRLVDACVDRPAEMFEERAEHPPIEGAARAAARSAHARHRGRLRVADHVQPRAGSQHGAGPAETREEAATARLVRHGISPPCVVAHRS